MKATEQKKTSASQASSSKAAAVSGAGADTEMAEAEEPARGVEGAGRGTKRSAEDAAEQEHRAVTVTPDAKRRKTDADWGELKTWGSHSTADSIHAWLHAYGAWHLGADVASSRQIACWLVACCGWAACIQCSC